MGLHKDLKKEVSPLARISRFKSQSKHYEQGLFEKQVMVSFSGFITNFFILVGVNETQRCEVHL
jgi:hypothetical protein